MSLLHTLDACAYTNRLHTRHPGEKLLLSAGMLLLALLVPPWPGALVLIGVMLLATLGLARVPVRAYLMMIAGPLAFLLAGALSLCLSLSWQSGTLQLAWAPDGGRQALLVSLRALAALTALLFLTGTTPLPELLLTMRGWRVPAAVVELALLIYRFLFAFAETLAAMQTAQAARLGYSSWRTTYRALASVTATLFQRVFARARQMDDGLAARGWDGELHVLSREYPGSSAVYVIIIVGHLALGALLYWLALFYD